MSFPGPPWAAHRPIDPYRPGGAAPLAASEVEQGTQDTLDIEMEQPSALAEDIPSAQGETEELQQARIAHHRAKKVLEAVAHIAGPETLHHLQAEARVAKERLDAIRPPQERLAALLESERSRVQLLAKLEPQIQVALATVADLRQKASTAQEALARTRDLIKREQMALAMATPEEVLPLIGVSHQAQALLATAKDGASVAKLLAELEAVKAQALRYATHVAGDAEMAEATNKRLRPSEEASQVMDGLESGPAAPAAGSPGREGAAGAQADSGAPQGSQLA